MMYSWGLLLALPCVYFWGVANEMTRPETWFTRRWAIMNAMFAAFLAFVLWTAKVPQ